MRDNIFNRLQQSGYDIAYEIGKLHEMFTENFFAVKKNITGHHFSSGTKCIEEIVEMFSFYKWKQRGGLISLVEFKNRVGIGDLVEAILNDDSSIGSRIQDIIVYLEYMLNVLNIEEKIDYRGIQKYNLEDYKATYDESKRLMLMQNLVIMVEHLNLVRHFNKKEELIILVEKDANVTAVAEIIDKQLFWPVIEYNHHLLKESISRKREILKKFADDLEHKRIDLKGINKSFTDNLFYAFNHLNIRHDNSDIEFVAKLSRVEAEKWYDEIYQLILYAYILLDSPERIQKIKTLKYSIETSKQQSKGELT